VETGQSHLKFEIRIRETNSPKDVSVLTPLRATVEDHLGASTILSEVHTEGGVVVIVNRAENIGVGLGLATMLSGK
jgi:hypothetical protein